MSKIQVCATNEMGKEHNLCVLFLDVMGDFTHVDEFVSNRSKSTWDKLIEIDQEKAIDLMLGCYDLMGPRERIDLLDNDTYSEFYDRFARKVLNDIEEGTFEEINDPLWLSLLGNSVIYNIKRRAISNNLTKVFLKLSVLGYYSDKDIEALDYMQIALVVCLSFFGERPEVLDWLSNNVADRWLLDSYFDAYENALNEDWVTPEGRACMDKLKFRWERLKLNARQQEAIQLVQPEVSAL
jgi:hypothetical protein